MRRRFKETQDQEARDKLILHHMKVVKYIAGRMAMHVPSTVDLDDLVGWGIMGLMDAIEKFDHSARHQVYDLCLDSDPRRHY